MTMNAKTLKTLRNEACTSLKSSKLKGAFMREEYMRKVGLSLGATHKQVKRSVRVVSAQFGQKPPEWARALHFVRKLVRLANHLLGIPRNVYRNIGFKPV